MAISFGFRVRSSSQTGLLISIPTEAEAATQASLYAIVVDRPGNAPLSNEAKAIFPIIQQLDELP